MNVFRGLSIRLFVFKIRWKKWSEEKKKRKSKEATNFKLRQTTFWIGMVELRVLTSSMCASHLNGICNQNVQIECVFAKLNVFHNIAVSKYKYMHTNFICAIIFIKFHFLLLYNGYRMRRRQSMTVHWYFNKVMRLSCWCSSLAYFILRFPILRWFVWFSSIQLKSSHFGDVMFAVSTFHSPYRKTHWICHIFYQNWSHGNAFQQWKKKMLGSVRPLTVLSCCCK